MSNKNAVIISIGSNTAEKNNNVLKALNWFEGISDSFVSSGIYETPEVHGRGESYMNAVGRGYVSCNFETLLNLCKRYELLFGRTDEMRLLGKVPIDIDIVVWNDDIIRPLDFNREFFQIGYSEIS